MAWAIAYSATVLALAYAIPRGLAIWAQFSIMRDQTEAFAATASSGDAEVDWDKIQTGGGYA